MSEARSRNVLHVCGVTVAALGALIVAGVLVAAALGSGSVPVSKAEAVAAAPVRPTNDVQALRRFRTRWADSVRVSVAAFRAHDTAGAYLRSGNDVAASGELKKCQSTAAGIVRGSAAPPADSAAGFDAELSAAVEKIAEGLQNGCAAALSYLQTSAPADYENAQTHFAGVVDGIFQSQQLARLKYQSLGGNPDSLLDFKTALR